MQISTPGTKHEPLTIMEILQDILGNISYKTNSTKQIETIEARLNWLEYEARRHNADETTLAAIKGARVLLELTGLPLPQIVPCRTPGR